MIKTKQLRLNLYMNQPQSIIFSMLLIFIDAMSLKMSHPQKMQTKVL